MLSFLHFYRIILTVTVLITGPALGAEIVIKFSHIASRDSPKGLAATHFKEAAERLTRGRVRVDVYPDSQLFKDGEELEALQMNSVQMVAPTFSKFSTIGFHEFEVFDLPFLFRNISDVHRVTQGPIGRTLLGSLDRQGIIGLGFWDNGFKNMSANVPLHSPQDMRGLRMRIQPSRVLANQMTALGATPFALSFADTYQFLGNGLIDGTETTPSLFYTLGLINLQKYLTMTQHGYLGYVVITNKRFWESLPKEIQVALTAAINETTTYVNTIAIQKNESDLEIIARSGRTTVIALNPTERRLWFDAMSAVEMQSQQRVGKELIQNIRKELSETSQ